MVISYFIQAQSVSIINPSSIQISQLNASQANQYNRIASNPSFSTFWFVQFCNLESIQANGWVTLSVPDKECNSVLQAKYVASYDNGNYYWHGELQKPDGDSEESCSCYDGYMNITKHNGKTFGTLAIDDDRYELFDLGEGIHVLGKKDFINHQTLCGNSSEEGSGFSTPLSPRTNGNCPVRVLALFTQNGEDAVGDIEATIRQSINDANQALRNSEVTDCDLQLYLIGIEEINFTETNNPVVDRNLSSSHKCKEIVKKLKGSKNFMVINQKYCSLSIFPYA